MAYANSIEVSQSEKLFDQQEDFDSYSQAELNTFYRSFPKKKKIPLFKKCMRSFVKELPENQQIVLGMTFWEGKNSAEIARRMKVHKSSVLRVKEKALKKLSERFTDIALEAYKRKQNLPYLDIDKLKASKSEQDLKKQLQSTCSKWPPRIWERCLFYIENDKNKAKKQSKDSVKTLKNIAIGAKDESAGRQDLFY